MKSKVNYKIVISDSAKFDISESAKWYNHQQPELGKRFVKSIKACIATIKSQPRIFQVRYKNNHVGIAKKFPYLIIYNIDEENKTINIIAIFHSARNPSGFIDKPSEE